MDNNDFQNNNNDDFNSSSQSQNNQEQQISDFVIPEEYKEKDWTKNFTGKIGDELKADIFKTLDEKFSNTPIIPENAQAYSLNDILKDENGELQYEYPDEVLNFFGDKFKELGLTKEQGQGILKQYTDFELKEFEKHTNADELEKNINALFNGNQQQKTSVESLIKEFLPREDQVFLQKTAPNYTIEMFYKLAKGLTEKYGYKESSLGSDRNNSGFRMSEADRNSEYNRIVTEMENLKNRPHTWQETENLQKQLNNLFK